MAEMTEPSSEARVFAATMWQIYVALRLQGFTEGQALTVIGHMIQASK